jgi:hypothetical protein
MKNTSTLILRNSLLLLATLFAISNLSATAQTKFATPRITQAIDETNLVPMHTKVHPLARAGFDQGVVPDSRPMNRILLVLKRSPDQETALRTLMDAQQTKNSPNYHTWLTPAQFAEQFGVAGADIQKVTAWLTQKGFTGIKPSQGGMFIEFSGTAGLVRSAFHTEIHSFLVNGETHVANVSVPQMPAALAPVITGIHSLHNFRKNSYLHYSQALAKAKAEGKLKPGFGTGAGLYAVGPGDFAKIYNLPPTSGAGALDGTGQTIALVARSNIAVSDVNQFGTGFGISNLTSFTAASNIILSGPDPGIMQPDDGEATLDVEWSGSVAPKAKLLLVVSDSQETTSTDGVDLSAFYIVDFNVAPIMSESFGACEAAIDDAFEFSLWEEAAAQGITVMVSTGDTGSASCDPDNYINASDAGLQISGTASTPFNVAVGGTDFNDANNPLTYWNDTAALETAKSYIPEIPWNDSCASTATALTLNSVCASIDPNQSLNGSTGLDLSGGGGGASTCGLVNGSGDCEPYPKPSWQTGTGVPADSARDIPDVSLYAAVNSASNNFYIMCLADSAAQNGQACNLTGPNFNFTGVGGTSVSSPAFAGIVALVNQNEVNNSRLKAGEGQGNINYVLYKLAAAQNTTPGTALCNASTAAPNSACTFNDITLGNNSVACVGSFTTPNGFGNLNNPNCSTQVLNAIGVLVEPTATTTPGWTATAGYDLATGLGSVNATNLVTNWHTVTSNYLPSTTTITAPAAGSVTIGHGANVNFTVKVAQNSGTTVPTGDVSLIAQTTASTQFGLNFGTLGAPSPAGQVVIATNELPGGTYPVVAHYTGDGTFAASDSAPFNVTVSKENSTTQTALISVDPISGGLTTVSSVPYGSIYLFRTDVLGTQNGDNQICSEVPPPGIPCPTGTITLTDTGGVAIKDFLSTATGGSTNIATLNAFGFQEDRLLGTTGLIGGAHNYTAAYSGDSSYNASQVTLPITITAASTGTGVLANGQSTISVPTGQPVTLVATATGFNVIDGEDWASGGAGPTGSITFKNGTTTIATVSVTSTPFNSTTGASAFATASTTATFNTAGVQTISATFTTGDTNYTGSTSSGSSNAVVTVTSGVGPAAKVVFTVQPSNVVAGASITPAVQVSVEDASGNLVTTATNAVTIAIGTNPGGGTLSGTLTANAVAGVATFTNLSINKGGTGYTLTAAATGLTGATSSAFNVTTPVGPAAKLAFTVQPSNVALGASIAPAVQVSVDDTNGNVVTTATNAVTIAIGTNPGGGTLSGTLTANAVAGVASFSTLSINKGGTGYTLTAAATGLTGATSSAFNVASFTVAYNPQPLTLSSATGTATALTITVTPVGGFTGTVAFTPTAASLPPGVSCTPSPLNITVAAGPANGTLNCMVTAHSTVLTASNVREDRMLDAKAVPPTGAMPPATGGKRWLTLSAGTGFAALFLLFLPGGRKKYRAAFGLGLVCLLSLTVGCSGAGSHIVPPPLTPTVTKLTANAGTEVNGTAFTFSVAVTGGTPTGQVQLFDGANMIGTAATVAGGTAAPTAPALSVGTHAISAHYLGDATTAASASGTLNLTTTGPTTIAITSSPAATPVAPAINVTVQ